jgi:flagellar hook-associated protein 2
MSISSTNSNAATGQAILKSLGVGASVDTSSLISALVSAEGQATLSSIANQGNADNTILSGLGSLKSALSTFQSALQPLQNGSVFQALNINSSDTATLTATSSTGALPGSHTIQVQQLAAAQESISTAGFSGLGATVGTGTLTFTSGSGSTFNVNVGSSNDTVAGILNAINSASGNTFLKASVMNVDNGSGGTVSKIVLSATNTGSAGGFTVTGNDDDGNNNDNSGLSSLFSPQLQSVTPAQNAIVQVDGQTATRSSNTITDVLSGVTLNLLQAKSGENITLGLTPNTSAVTTAVNNFVSAYNTLHSTMQSLGQYGGSAALGQNNSSNNNGPLIGNFTLTNLETTLRSKATDTVSSATSSYNSLAMIGISIDHTGTMSVDTTTLNNALNSNSQSISDVFSSTNGIANTLNTLVTQYTQSGGPIDTQTQSLNNQINSLTTQQTNENQQLQQYQQMLTKEFTAMNTSVAQYSSTGSFLSGWISSGG